MFITIYFQPYSVYKEIILLIPFVTAIN